MTTLKVQKRNRKDKAKKLRREGFVTGSLFGKELDGAISIQIEGREADRIRRECLKGSQLYLELDGKTYDVLLKEMDFGPVNHELLEMDFQALVKGEKVHSVAEIVLHNREKIFSGVVEQMLSEIRYKATPDQLLDKINLDCSNLKDGDAIKVSDLDIAKNQKIDLLSDPDAVVLRVIHSHVEEADTTEETQESA